MAEILDTNTIAYQLKRKYPKKKKKKKTKIRDMYTTLAAIKKMYEN